MNLASILEDSARYFPDKTAIIEDDRVYTYREFNDYATRIASKLVELGVQPGDYVGFCAPNSYDWVALYFGTLKCGAVAVTFSYRLTKNEFLKILFDCKPKVLFTSESRLSDLDYGDSRYRPEHIIIEKGAMSCVELAANGDPNFMTIDRERDDIAAILYTGGTTGLPKGAMLSHINILYPISNVARYERSSERDITLCFLPLNHVFGQMHIVNSTIYSSGAIVIQPAFNMDMALDAIRRHKVTKFFAVPTIYIRMLEIPDLKEKFKSVTYCFSAAASMAAEVVREWRAKTGLNIFESYGLTESASIVTFNHYHRHVIGSVGTAANLMEIQIRDKLGKPLEQGEIGEICIRGLNIFKGYLNNSKETAKSFWFDWFRTGDTGYIDKDGYVFIVDRVKDMIITGGENVYPREVEEVLYTCACVQECSVIGLPDREYGEKVTACIVLKNGHQFDPVALKQYLKQNLAGYKVPKEYFSVEDLPKSSNGKILKTELKKRFI